MLLSVVLNAYLSMIFSLLAMHLLDAATSTACYLYCKNAQTRVDPCTLECTFYIRVPFIPELI